MSYVPFQPDVWPPAEPEIDLRPKIRILRWACAIVLYLLLIVGWVYWMKLPPKIQPPLATIHLADGTELRLVDVSLGKRAQLFSHETFGNRIRAPERDMQSRATVAEAEEGVWLALSHFDPQSKKFAAPALESISIQEDGSPYPLYATSVRRAEGAYVMALFPAVPRRAPTWQVAASHRGEKVSALITNPLLTLPSSGSLLENASAKWQAKPLPQEMQANGFTARVEKVNFSEWTNPTLGIRMPRALPVYRVSYADPAAKGFSHSVEWFDATGNRVRNGVLPWSEPVWGLRVTITETEQFPVPPERLTVLGTVKVPGANQAQALPVPPQLAAHGITDVFLLGPGSYTWSGNRLMASGSPQGSATILKSKGNPRYGGMSESAWALYFTGTRKDGTAGRWPVKFRVQNRGALCTHSSSGSSSRNEYREQHFGNYRHPKNGPIPAGEDVTIELFAPSTYTLDFLLSRPEFSGRE